MMGVCRGKLSEGIDFSDDTARCVIMVSIPYSQINDPNVLMKQTYLDEEIEKEADEMEDNCGTRGNEFHTLTGKQWYQQEAMRAVNQSIGRVIRHIHDYGIIILADERYAWDINKKQISLWVRESL